MTAHSIKTDNANVSHKVQLRKEATQNLKSLKVLDLVAGNNVLWSNFDCEKYYGVEKVKGKGKNLYADNERVIASLDLSKFNVIDCDSYGVPFNQLAKIFENKTLSHGTVIIYTCIGNALSALPNEAKEFLGLTEMYKKSKTLLNAKSGDLFYEWLYLHGVENVREYEEPSKSFKKKYGYFVIKE